jgi:hypothetical protein
MCSVLLGPHINFVGLVVSAGSDLYHDTFDDVYWHLHAREGDNSNDCLESDGQVCQTAQ